MTVEKISGEDLTEAARWIVKFYGNKAPCPDVEIVDDTHFSKQFVGSYNVDQDRIFFKSDQNVDPRLTLFHEYIHSLVEKGHLSPRDERSVTNEARWRWAQYQRRKV